MLTATQAVSDEIPFELFWPMVKDDIAAQSGWLRSVASSPRGHTTYSVGVRRPFLYLEG